MIDGENQVIGPQDKIGKAQIVAPGMGRDKLDGMAQAIAAISGQASLKGRQTCQSSLGIAGDKFGKSGKGIARDSLPVKINDLVLGRQHMKRLGSKEGIAAEPRITRRITRRIASWAVMPGAVQKDEIAGCTQGNGPGQGIGDGIGQLQFMDQGGDTHGQRLACRPWPIHPASGMG
jgi:hypothetical protein